MKQTFKTVVYRCGHDKLLSPGYQNTGSSILCPNCQEKLLLINRILSISRLANADIPDITPMQFAESELSSLDVIHYVVRGIG
jgi:hypothetical protein